MEKTTQTNQITEGVIWQQLLLFFFPILFGTFFQQLYNTVDAVVVGQYVGTEALAAVGGTTGTLTCGSCAGRGENHCFVCQGSGWDPLGEVCENCDGRGEVTCTACNGTGHL